MNYVIHQSIPYARKSWFTYKPEYSNIPENIGYFNPKCIPDYSSGINIPRKSWYIGIHTCI